MESEFSLFPEKLRVLVVDDDPVCVKVITQMLKQCNYEVTQVAQATEAVETLRKNPKGFDMVITDTCNDVDDAVSLIVKVVRSENIPVILVSGSEDSSTLMKLVLHGADEVISKPVSLAKVKNLWQHAYRKRLHVQDQQKQPSSEGEEDSGRKAKKARLRWQGSLQERFMQAVIQLGGPSKALPKQIMEIMNAPEVSRESVASHLQKYRKQNSKRFIVHRNDTNGILPSSSAASTPSSTVLSAHNVFPHVPHSSSSYQSTSTAAPRFGGYQSYQYNHHPRQHSSGFSGPMGHHRIMGGGSSHSSSSFHPGIGAIPARPLTMVPPPLACVPPQQPSTVISNQSNNNSFVRLALPQQSQTLPPPSASSMATDHVSNNYTNNNNNISSFAAGLEKLWADNQEGIDESSFKTLDHQDPDQFNIQEFLCQAEGLDEWMNGF